MLKVYLKLRKTESDDHWAKGDILTMNNEVFSKDNGIAFFKLSRGWEVLEMKVTEYKEIKTEE